jgi:nucleoside-diphosphate-sugar epimerase
MRVLFIGGTGTISTACTALAAQRGIELTLLNRGQRKVDVPAGVEVLTGDINNDRSGVEALVKDRHFDVVVNWIAFTADQIERDIEIVSVVTDGGRRWEENRHTNRRDQSMTPEDKAKAEKIASLINKPTLSQGEAMLVLQHMDATGQF